MPGFTHSYFYSPLFARSHHRYKRLPLYTPAVMEKYIKKGTRKMPPHIFNIADDSFKNLRNDLSGQVLPDNTVTVTL
jgi:myosin heavy subunit